MIPLSFSFLKSQPTVGELRKVVMTASSPSKQSISTGDKFVARQGNTKYPQVVSEGSITSYPSDFTSLTPRASDILNNININNIKCKAVKQGDVFRELGIKIL